MLLCVPECFTGVKARIVYDNIYIMHFDLVKSLPWITSLSEIQGKHFNITISRSNPLLRYAPHVNILYDINLYTLASYFVLYIEVYTNNTSMTLFC